MLDVTDADAQGYISTFTNPSYTAAVAGSPVDRELLDMAKRAMNARADLRQLDDTIRSVLGVSRGCECGCDCEAVSFCECTE